MHMRNPIQLFQELRFRGFLTFQAVVGGNALVALAHLAFLFGIILEFCVPIFLGNHPAATLHSGYSL